ncbi:hypothetical protein LJR235_005380 [Pararhizobium sp. LjRoot235]|uniref:hypothetical protein n=1 Tax=Pararhizobium sp. LjRoot235 TaxID=3342291 RepID=UPI003ECFB860
MTSFGAEKDAIDVRRSGDTLSAADDDFLSVRQNEERFFDAGRNLYGTQGLGLDSFGCTNKAANVAHTGLDRPKCEGWKVERFAFLKE